MRQRLKEILKWFKDNGENITVLTGAGVSVASGLPTFRGRDGIWQVGSKNYKPQTVATKRMFDEKPFDAWQWNLYRWHKCMTAQPNICHEKIVDLEHYFQNKFRLITLNIDNLHQRAGSTTKRTYEIHGKIGKMRCSQECTTEIFSVPQEVKLNDKKELDEKCKKLLICPKCGKISRPHVLWFDEIYNEHFYKIESARSFIAQTQLIIIIGLSAATNPSGQFLRAVRRNGDGGGIVVIDPNENLLGNLAESLDTARGVWCENKATEILPEIVEFLI